MLCATSAASTVGSRGTRRQRLVISRTDDRLANRSDRRRAGGPDAAPRRHRAGRCLLEFRRSAIRLALQAGACDNVRTTLAALLHSMRTAVELLDATSRRWRQPSPGWPRRPPRPPRAKRDAEPSGTWSRQQKHGQVVAEQDWAWTLLGPCYPLGAGADARSMAANSSPASSKQSAPEFSRTCSDLVAPGIGITRSACFSSYASATRVAVAL